MSGPSRRKQHDKDVLHIYESMQGGMHEPRKRPTCCFLCRPFCVAPQHSHPWRKTRLVDRHRRFHKVHAKVTCGQLQPPTAFRRSSHESCDDICGISCSERNKKLNGFESLNGETPSLPPYLPESGGLDPISGRNSYPARPHYGPTDVAWILRALSGVLKASPGPLGPRFGTSSGRNRKEGLTP